LIEANPAYIDFRDEAVIRKYLMQEWKVDNLYGIMEFAHDVVDFRMAQLGILPSLAYLCLY